MIVEIPCVCGSHEVDRVTLRDTLDFRAAVTVRNAILLLVGELGETPSTAEVSAVLNEWYLLLGVEAWTLVDARSKPVPVNRTTIREHLLSHVNEALIIGDAADELYSAAVVLPLLAAASSSSQPGPTPASTSRRTSAPSKPRRRSSQSSIASIPTADTATTGAPPDGVSSISQRSASA